VGRHLFWRKAVIFVLFLCVFGGWASSLPAWLESKKKHSQTDVAHQSARQGHCGPEVFLIDIPRNEVVLREIKIYDIPYNRERLKEILAKGNTYRGFIISRLRNMGMPAELYFIPLIESQYEPRAVSSSGAVGLWQLMEASSSEEGLIRDEWRDERKDFWEATEAALAILKANYECYKDWLLALAAYNAGRGAIDAAIIKAGSRDFFELVTKGFLPEETASYVPKILAACLIGTYPGRNRLPYSWDKGLAWTRVRITRSIDLESLAASSSVPVATIREGNTELFYGVTPPPSVEYFLKTPLCYKGALEKALQLPDEVLLYASLYTVCSGDTFYGLARYYGIPLSVLQSCNAHIAPQALLVGERIIIPRLKDNAPPPPRVVLFTGRQFASVYTVVPGDTLFAIARRFAVPVEELVFNNNLKLESVIRPGDALKVPASSADE
jgi:membrane-bound lytic murein transglycosylase D